MFKLGDVILTQVQFTDTFEIKIRPAVVLYSEYGNVVAAAVTSNLQMNGIPITKGEGAVVDSRIKLNYIFTIAEGMIKKPLFSLSSEKKKLLISELVNKLEAQMA